MSPFPTLLAALLCLPATAAPAKDAPPFDGDCRAYWLNVCARCHGVNGDGRDTTGKELPDAGFDFTDSRKANRRKDGDWVKATLEGKDKMPAFKSRLTEDQVRRMILEVLRPFAARR